MGRRRSILMLQLPAPPPLRRNLYTVHYLEFWLLAAAVLSNPVKKREVETILP